MLFIAAFMVMTAWGIGVLVGGCQGQPGKYTGPPDKLTLAAYAGDTGALVYVAQEQGFFADNGLEVIIKDIGVHHMVGEI